MNVDEIDLEPNTLAALHGTIVFLPNNVGSKSEACVPYLYMNKDEKVQIIKEGDNPFENSSLIKYDGTQVQIKGVFQNKIFKVFEIEINRSQKND